MAASEPIYSCKGKGGEYRVLYVATPAGTSRPRGKVVVYQDIATLKIYYREEMDFHDRMEVTGYV